jgi:hypothetical protein
MTERPEPTSLWLAGCQSSPWWRRLLARWLCDEPREQCPGFGYCITCGRTFDE